MSISYHGVIGHTAKVTLPSAEMYNMNMNILRDPPKSIMTRKKEKVGETSSITQMIQESGDRVCESINVYARGVNPMVAVSFGNNGNNGGTRVNGIQTGGNVSCQGKTNSGTQSYLPHRILNQGAFRPPIKTQRELMPLSRLPRLNAKILTNPGFADYTKRLMCPKPDVKTRQVKNPDRMLSGGIRPTAYYNIHTPIVEPFEVKYVIKNPTNVNVDSGKRFRKRFNGEMGTVTQQIVKDKMKIDQNVNKGGHRQKRTDLSHFNTEKFVQEPVRASAIANKSENIYSSPIEENYILNKEFTRDQFNISHETGKTGYTKQEYIHDDISLQRHLPVYEARTNIGQNIYSKPVEEHVQEREYTMNRPTLNIENNRGPRQEEEDFSRHYVLKPTINAGGYTPNFSQPTYNGDHQLLDFDSDKTKMRRRVYEMQLGRNI